MQSCVSDMIAEFFQENEHLAFLRSDVEKAVDLLIGCFSHGGKVLCCGNGGSASDSEHIVGEFMKGFRKKRPVDAGFIARLSKIVGDEPAAQLASTLQCPLPAISLVSQTSLMSAFVNDVSAGSVYAQQVLGYGKRGDVLIAISTSGNSLNVVNAAKVAKALELDIIALTGQRDSQLSGLGDVTLRSPDIETYKVQEDHIRFYHLLCAAVEEEFFRD